MRTEKQIRKEVEKFQSNLLDNIQTFSSSNMVSLRTMKTIINTLRWTLGETTKVIPIQTYTKSTKKKGERLK